MAEATPEESIAETTSQRFIFVRYNKADGNIVATHETILNEEESPSPPWGVIEGKEAARIAVTGDLEGKELIEIHKNYKVELSEGKPTLVKI